MCSSAIYEIAPLDLSLPFRLYITGYAIPNRLSRRKNNQVRYVSSTAVVVMRAMMAVVSSTPVIPGVSVATVKR